MHRLKTQDYVSEASQSGIAKNRDFAGEKAEQEKRLAEQILPLFVWSPSTGRPQPQLKDIARTMLSPLAKTAIEVLKR